jgi:hypothetical protein
MQKFKHAKNRRNLNTDRHDITGIFLEVALNTTILTLNLDY